MLKALFVAALVALPVTAMADFKSFSMDGHTTSVYNEHGATFGIDLVKEGGQKVFYANFVLPKGAEFRDDIVNSSYGFDSSPLVRVSESSKSDRVGKSGHAISWVIDSFPDNTMKVPEGSNLDKFMRYHQLRISYLSKDGNTVVSTFPLTQSYATITKLIKR